MKLFAGKGKVLSGTGVWRKTGTWFCIPSPTGPEVPRTSGGISGVQSQRTDFNSDKGSGDTVGNN